MIRIIGISIITSTIFLLTACSSDNNPSSSNGSSVPADTALFASDVQPILASRCATTACHGNQANPTGGLFLGNPPDYTTVRNASGNNGQIIMPGDGPNSNLYTKTTATPIFGSQMPLTGAKLTTAQQENINVWINLGALDN